MMGRVSELNAPYIAFYTADGFVPWEESVSMMMYSSVFSPGYTDQRAQIVSHDHAPHLKCSNSQFK